MDGTNEGIPDVVPFDGNPVECDKALVLSAPIGSIDHSIVDAVASKLDITEASEVAMLREQDALAVARARALTHEDTDHEVAQDSSQLLVRAPSPISPLSKLAQATESAVAPPTSNTIEGIIALASESSGGSPEIHHYEPLRGQWHYGQAVLARYKRTPYFHSGNIATYLGGGLFMIVFDDGSLNYRVKRDDIVLRPLSSIRHHTENGGDESSAEPLIGGKGDSNGEQHVTWYRTDVHLSDKPVMVDFSVSPPRQISAGRAGYDVADNAWLDAKHLECGVAYEDDSTQVSDSDDSSEEDMTMTPWQQMTQTFGMGMGGGGGGGARHHKQRASTRRSSISSLSQIDRLSMTGKSMNQILPSPKGIKQTIQDYLAKKTKKVQPSTVSMDPISEIIRKMEIRREDIQNIRNGRMPTFRSSFSGASSGPTISAAASGYRLERSRSTTGSFLTSRNPGGRDRSASAASATASFTVTSVGSIGSGGSSLATTHGISSATTTATLATSPTSTRVVFQRESDGVRSYGTVMSRLPNGDYEVVAESEQTIVVQVLPIKDLDFLPSLNELNAQIQDLQQQSKRLYAGRKVQVNLYPGTRFSGQGVITLEDDTIRATIAAAGQNGPSGSGGLFHVLLNNRIRLINVPADKIIPVKEKKKEPVRITEDQFLVCQGKVKVHIGDQVFVKCEGDSEGQIEEKLGVLNGVYSNKTAAIDFADGSTGYEISPSLITKRKRATLTEDLDLLSLKNAVLMQALRSNDGFQVDVGYQVKADHPVRASVETCVVIRKHESSACDLKFADGTMAFGVFPSQMIMDKNAVDATLDKTPIVYEAHVGEIVLVWSSRFMRYCSAKIATKTIEAGQALYAIVFDYGEQKDRVPAEKIARIDEPDALSPTQKLTNYTFDTIGFEIQPVAFSVGEAVMARVHGSIQYFNGWIEAIREKERTCVVVFDSSVRDENVKFSCMFSVDMRNRFRSLGQQTCSGSSAGTGVAGAVDDNASDVSGTIGGNRKRRHSAGSMGSMIMSVAGSIFQARKKAERLERRTSQLVTEVGAVVKHRPDD